MEDLPKTRMVGRVQGMCLSRYSYHCQACSLGTNLGTCITSLPFPRSITCFPLSSVESVVRLGFFSDGSRKSLSKELMAISRGVRSGEAVAPPYFDD